MTGKWQREFCGRSVSGWEAMKLSKNGSDAIFFDFFFFFFCVCVCAFHGSSCSSICTACRRLICFWQSRQKAIAVVKL